MLAERILATIKFFDLQDYPLTLLELQEFLLAPPKILLGLVDESGELAKPAHHGLEPQVTLTELIKCLDGELVNLVNQTLGFYHWPGRQQLAELRLGNYAYGLPREKLLRRYGKTLRHVPFVRGAALAGSQALGLQKPQSDIDLLIIVQPGFLWLARTLVTGLFQIFGKRRHGQKIANRFCLNHYLAGPKTVTQWRNCYTATEYLKLRPLVSPVMVAEFQKNNLGWINQLMPNAQPTPGRAEAPSRLQARLESWLNNSFGRAVETRLKNWQLPKIRREKYIVVDPDELSFHPQSKQVELLNKFFGDPFMAKYKTV